MKILIVDDCPTTRKLLGHYLRTNGYSTVFAENGLDAMEKLASEPVNLIVTDLNMPYMDGIEFIKTLRSDPSWDDIPILMVTTENDESEKEKAIGLGANGYLIKPVSSNVITEHVRSIIKSIFAKGGITNV